MCHVVGDTAVVQWTEQGKDAYGKTRILAMTPAGKLLPATAAVPHQRPGGT